MTTATAPAAAKPAKAVKPTIAQRAAERVCPECGGAVVRKSAKGPMPTFCTPACKQARNNRRLTRGAALIEFAQAWRGARGSGEIAQASFQQMCNILDTFNAEDREAARPRADLMAAKILVEGTNYCDRRRIAAAA
jgi:hypothetical protein